MYIVFLIWYLGEFLNSFPYDTVINNQMLLF